MFKRVYEKLDGRYLYLYGTKLRVLNPLEEGEEAPEARPHLRWHLLRDEWDVYTAHRGKSTFLPSRDIGRCAPVVQSLPHRDPPSASRSPCSDWGWSLAASRKDRGI